MLRRRLLFILYYAAVATLIALWMGQAHWLSYYRLAKDGINARALVTQTTCADRATFSYRFTVNGQAIEGRGAAGSGTPPCEALKPGDTVQVFYLPAEPRKNLPGNPQELLGSETAFIAMAAFILPLVLLFILFLLLRKRQQATDRRE